MIQDADKDEPSDKTKLLPDPPVQEVKGKKFLQKALLAGKLFWSDPKIKLLLPLNAAFGFVAAFVNGYLNGDITKAAVGENNIG